jgi:hypothetical protein
MSDGREDAKVNMADAASASFSRGAIICWKLPNVNDTSLESRCMFEISRKEDGTCSSQ